MTAGKVEADTVTPRGTARPPGRSTRLDRATALPTVGVVVPTHDRPALVRRALASILEQDYEGAIDVVVVFDRSDPDLSLAQSTVGRSVRVLVNDRTPGLAGSRNSGIVRTSADLVAFCDDDDVWEPDKLRRQVAALDAEPRADFATTAMVVDYDGRCTVRLAGTSRVTHADLVRSRMAMLHSSSFLIRREALLSRIGLVDETLPRSMAEDWDLLLRAAAEQPILHVDRPLVRVQWGAGSYFADQWSTRNEARLWMLDHHEQIRRDPVALGLTYSKLAFGCAALGQQADAFRWAAKAARANWREPRTVLAVAVALRLVSWQRVVRTLNRRGRGI